MKLQALKPTGLHGSAYAVSCCPVYLPARMQHSSPAASASQSADQENVEDPWESIESLRANFFHCFAIDQLVSGRYGLLSSPTWCDASTSVAQRSGCVSIPDPEVVEDVEEKENYEEQRSCLLVVHSLATACLLRAVLYTSAYLPAWHLQSPSVLSH